MTLFHSWTEMGQGIHTALRQIACDGARRSPPTRIRVVVDTEHELDTGETTASRATMLGGRAVLDAARRLRDGARGRAASRRSPVASSPGEFVVDWTTAPDGDDAEPVTHLAYGWATQVVILDDDRPDRAGHRGPGRRPGDQPDARSRARWRAASTWASATR